MHADRLAAIADFVVDAHQPAPYGEVPASREFARRYVNSFRYCPEWGYWLVWDNRRWLRDSAGQARRQAKLFCDELADRARSDVICGDRDTTRERTAQRLQQKKYVDAVLDLAKVESQVVVRAEQFDADSMLLNTPGGTVDLHTGSLRAHQRDDFITLITKETPATGPRPVFDRFLAEVTCGDRALADYLQRGLGALLSGAMSDHWLMFWYGSGANGKNTLGDLVLDALGDYAKVIPTQTLMADKHGNRHPTEVANLRGIRLAVSSEVSEGESWNESRVKELTGDAMLTGRFMYQNYFQFRRTHKHVVYGNHPPQLRVVDAAMARRVHMVPFGATFSTENGTLDPSMPSKLQKELAQVLRWLIEGHQKWLEDGTLHCCAAVTKCTKDYLDSQSTLEQWIEERVEIKADDGRAGRSWPKAGSFYADYAHWKRERGEQPLSATLWGEQMRKHFTTIRSNGRRIVGAKLRDARSD